MRPYFRGCLGDLALAIPLLTVLIVPIQSGFAQKIAGAAGQRRMSLGSTWSRTAGSPPVALSSSQSFASPASSSTRFFGGVTVGRGGYPFYYPGYYGSAGLFFPGTGCAVSARGLHVSIGSTNYGFFGTRRFLPSWYPGGFAGYSRYTVPLPTDVAAPFGAGAHRPPVSRSRVNPAPRVKFGSTFARPFASEHSGQLDLVSIKRKVGAAIEKAPVAGEFAAAAAENRDVTTTDRIESQRLQTHGDKALRNADLELARTFYQAAVRVAPDRQTPWVRIVWVHVAQRDFPKAAAALKRALLIHSQSGAGWVNAGELLKHSSEHQSWLTEAGLWVWLQDRPGSADRLLLTAAWQYFLGQNQTAVELVEMSHTAGISQHSYEALHRITTSRFDDRNTGSAGIPVSQRTADRDTPHQASASLPADPYQLIIPPPVFPADAAESPSTVDAGDGEESDAVPRLPSVISQ